MATLSPWMIHTLDVERPWITPRPLIERILENPVWKAQYLALVARLLDGGLGEDRFDELHARIGPFVAIERAPYTLFMSPFGFDHSLDKAVESIPGFLMPGLREFLERRRAFLGGG